VTKVLSARLAILTKKHAAARALAANLGATWPDTGSPSGPEPCPARLAILAEDHAAATSLIAYLADHRVIAVHTHTLTDLLQYFEPNHAAQQPDVVLLEAGSMLSASLPRLSRIRRISDVPCMVIGGKSDELDRIVLLEAGADDCLTMPVRHREILARVRVMLRRRGHNAPRATSPALDAPTPGASPAAARRLDLGNGWYLCRQRRDLYRPDGERCLLTTAEFELLDCLAKAAGQPVSREEACETVFRRRYWSEDRSVDNLVMRLRRKLEADARRPEVIRSIRPVGYMFAGFPDPQADRSGSKVS
jgi:DNA-binding response OmpR family regulator